MYQVLKPLSDAADILRDSTKPEWKRFAQWMDASTKLDLGQLRPFIVDHFKQQMAKIDRILAKYQLESDEDYQNIRENDLLELLVLMVSSTHGAIASVTNAMIKDMDKHTVTIPVETIQAIREYRDLLTPILTRELAWKVNRLHRGCDISGNSPFFILYLLVEFQAEEAWPVILEAVSLPSDDVDRLFDDAITESLGGIFAFYATDHIDRLDTIITNPDICEEVRWQACAAMTYLVRDGILTRSEAIGRLQRHLREAVDQNDLEIIHQLINELLVLSAKEALSDIKRAFDRGMVRPDYLDWEDVEISMIGGERLMRRLLECLAETGIQDTIEELECWYTFRKDDSEGSESVRRYPSPVGVTNISIDTKWLRDGDPCPCGSEETYLHCCLRSAEAVLP